MRTEDLTEKFEKLSQNLAKESFLSMSALGGEIPFYIVPYNPTQHNRVESKIKQLKDKLSREGISIYEIDLFELTIQMLQERDLFDKILQKEKQLAKRKLFKTLQATLDPETRLVKKISELAAANESQILFLTGIGSVYPYIRSHTVLNNLQNRIKDRPTVMFFPGTYGKDLSLFGRMKDDNYYRAFNLDTLNL